MWLKINVGKVRVSEEDMWDVYKIICLEMMGSSDGEWWKKQVAWEKEGMEDACKVMKEEDTIRNKNVGI